MCLSPPFLAGLSLSLPLQPALCPLLLLPLPCWYSDHGLERSSRGKGQVSAYNILLAFQSGVITIELFHHARNHISLGKITSFYGSRAV
jgi:hypothetical protein